MEPDRDRGTDTHTEMELDRDRGTDTHTGIDRQRDRQTETQIETQREGICYFCQGIRGNFSSLSLSPISFPTACASFARAVGKPGFEMLLVFIAERLDID